MICQSCQIDWTFVSIFPVAMAAACSKAMVMLLLIYCLLLFPMFVEILCLAHILLSST